MFYFIKVNIVLFITVFSIHAEPLEEKNLVDVTASAVFFQDDIGWIRLEMGGDAPVYNYNFEIYVELQKRTYRVNTYDMFDRPHENGKQVLWASINALQIIGIDGESSSELLNLFEKNKDLRSITNVKIAIFHDSEKFNDVNKIMKDKSVLVPVYRIPVALFKPKKEVKESAK